MWLLPPPPQELQFITEIMPEVSYKVAFAYFDVSVLLRTALHSQRILTSDFDSEKSHVYMVSCFYVLLLLEI